MIPSSMIKSIIYERELMNKDATQEVSNKWASEQSLIGPILSIPYTREHLINEKVTTTSHNFHILPSKLDITAEIHPEILRRGIYEIVVYGAHVSLEGAFDISIIEKLSSAKRILWEEAFVTIGISDLRGIKNEILLNWDNSTLPVDAGSRIKKIISSGITMLTPLQLEDKSSSNSFKLELQLNGSKNLSFVPVGGISKVSLESSWKAPSFNGSFLPEYRELTSEGFKAKWRTIELNRNYPQGWSDHEVTNALIESKFGVDLLLPIDDYQKSMRSAKYAILILALTFLIFFLVEIMEGHPIHPFQYILVGLALCLFYILLVSISEHSNFDLAYLISALSIVLMIGLYSISIFKKRKQSGILVSILGGLYGFLYVILQLADFALLMGSIGLAITLSATMYFTRKINWYNL